MENEFLEKGFTNTCITIDGNPYDVYKRQDVTESPEAPRLAVVSYLPRKTTIAILKLCIQAIRKFTEIPHELWIVDNNSPFENIKWLLDEKGVNLLFNRTKIRNGGSYANAVGLELIAQSISPATKYFMTLHQDIAPCKVGWLTYLLSKLNDSVKAAGVRMDKTRVKDGILHVLGYVVDFQTFKDLNLDFYPQLPTYDVGDKAIIKLKEAGYSVFASPNSLWDKPIIETLPPDSPFRSVQFDRSFDDHCNIFFLHLGRGVEKSKNTHNNPEKSIESWVEFLNANLLNNPST